MATDLQIMYDEFRRELNCGHHQALREISRRTTIDIASVDRALKRARREDVIDKRRGRSPGPTPEPEFVPGLNAARPTDALAEAFAEAEVQIPDTAFSRAFASAGVITEDEIAEAPQAPTPEPNGCPVCGRPTDFVWCSPKCANHKSRDEAT